MNAVMIKNDSPNGHVTEPKQQDLWPLLMEGEKD
jgi:hypothetical protein